MCKAMKVSIVLLLTLVGAERGVAANLYCSGTVDRSLIYANGNLMVLGSWRNAWTTICSINSVWQNSVEPEVCRSWLAVLESAKARNASVTIYYTDNGYTCATLPTYNGAPVPDYVSSQS